jgi:hypothetical protein
MYMLYFFVNIDDTLIYLYIWIYMFEITVVFTCDDILFFMMSNLYVVVDVFDGLCMCDGVLMS